MGFRPHTPTIPSSVAPSVHHPNHVTTTLFFSVCSFPMTPIMVLTCDLQSALAHEIKAAQNRVSEVRILCHGRKPSSHLPSLHRRDPVVK